MTKPQTNDRLQPLKVGKDASGGSDLPGSSKNAVAPTGQPHFCIGFIPSGRTWRRSGIRMCPGLRDGRLFLRPDQRGDGRDGVRDRDGRGVDAEVVGHAVVMALAGVEAVILGAGLVDGSDALFQLPVAQARFSSSLSLMPSLPSPRARQRAILCAMSA